jgi:Na+/H+-dicarboxylate symporter
MEKEFFKMPLWGVVLIALAAWHVMIPVVIISLFFGIRYDFIGENNMDPANKVMNKAADVTDSIKDEFNKPE